MPISFKESEADKLLHPRNDAPVKKLQITNNTILHVLVDNESLVDILFMNAFNRMRIVGAMLRPMQTLLYGFAGDFVQAVGTIDLPTIFRDGAEKVTRMVEFRVIDKPSMYNIILGKLTLNILKAVVSTYDLAMKFPTPMSVKIFKGDQNNARDYYVRAVNKICGQAASVSIIFKIDDIEFPIGEVKKLNDTKQKPVV